jgi:hypothetical protein
VLRRELGDEEKVGANLRILSTTLWRLCRGQEASQAVHEAVAVLEALPPSKELAWAYGSLAVDDMILGHTNEATLAYLGKARDIGERLDYPDLVSFVLNATGLYLVDAGQGGLPELEEGLLLALEADLPEAAGRAYSSLMEAATKLHRFPGRGALLRRGLRPTGQPAASQHVQQRLAIPRAALSGAVGRSSGGRHPEAGQPGHLAGQPAQPALHAGHHPGAPRRGRGVGAAGPGARVRRWDGRAVVDRAGARGARGAEVAGERAGPRGRRGHGGL